MPDQLPLSALLSQALVAFIVEFDNEFEHRMPHRTSNYGRTEGRGKVPWLVSMAMWSTCMRFVGEDGVTVGRLQALAGTGTNLPGMQRWGYVDVAPDPADTRPKPPQADWVIRATPQGRRAQEVWRPLAGEIEDRWRERFGAEVVGQLSEALRAIGGQLDPGLPGCLPVLGYGLFSKPSQPTAQASADHEHADLATLLSRVLLAFAIEFETTSALSLAISANTLRVLSDQATRVRDIPVLAGVSKEAVSMAMGILLSTSLAEMRPDPNASRGQVALLTPRGLAAQAKYRRLLGQVEAGWTQQFGAPAIGALRHPLEQLTGERAETLWRGLEPYPDGWRARVRKPTTLPHYPMVLHRGGFPDGS